MAVNYVIVNERRVKRMKIIIIRNHRVSISQPDDEEVNFVWSSMKSVLKINKDSVNKWVRSCDPVESGKVGKLLARKILIFSAIVSTQLFISKNYFKNTSSTPASGLRVLAGSEIRFSSEWKAPKTIPNMSNTAQNSEWMKIYCEKFGILVCDELVSLARVYSYISAWQCVEVASKSTHIFALILIKKKWSEGITE